MAAIRVLDPLPFLASFSYDPDTGTFVWKGGCAPCRIGTVAGYASNRGYWLLLVGGVRAMAHRVAWLHVHKEWPAGFIDHINRDTVDNRIANLRLATHAENVRNRVFVGAGRKTEFSNVHCRRSGQFRAVVELNGRKHYFGTHPTAEAAHHAAIAGKRLLHGEFAA